MRILVLPPLLLLGGFVSSCALTSSTPTTATVKLTQLSDRVRVEIGGQLFTEYIYADGASRPYCYPILAPDGTGLTRDFPMKKDTGDETDHPWHRSLWFAHSMMNQVDFWNEGTGDIGRSPKDKGRQVFDTMVETKDGAVGLIRTKSRWLAPDGRLICTDDRTLRFHPGPDGRFIDYEITLFARPDQPLLMGDNKDGTMATRVAQWMTLPHKVKEQEVGGHGHIVTSQGDRDAAAWGKRAPWADYHAPRGGQTYGIAIFDHPQNLRHPTWWMARGYGLFAANPFGQHDFEKEFANDPHKGDYTIPAGGRLTLRYRLYFHLGDDKSARLTDRYAEYAAGR